MSEIQNVLCSAGRGQQTKAACLACALNRKNDCGYDYALLVYLLNDGMRTGVHVTDLTGCLRKAYYARTEPAIEYPHEMIIRKLGTAVHAQLEGVDPNFKSEMPVEALGIVGKMDVFYNNGRIIDLKTTRWLTPSKLPYSSHGQQVNYYAALVREMGMPVTSAAIQYIDLSGPTKCKSCSKTFQMIDGELKCPKCAKTYASAHLGAVIFEIPLFPHAQVVKEITERRDALLSAIDTHLPPTPEQGFLCDYCAHRAICESSDIPF